MDNLLTVENLRVFFNSYAGKVHAVRGVSFHVNRGETLAIVGESGCGKTVTAKAVMRLHGRTSAVIDPESRIIFNGRDVMRLEKKELRGFRGGEASMIFQDSMTSLNPTMSIGNQITEALQLHMKITKAEALQKAEELLRLVEIPNPKERLKQYPHQLSGGMRQRVMISIALSCQPKLLIADEPTTALDVTIQAQLLDLLRSLKERFNMSIILVTHDLGVVAGFADRIQVMYAGNIVETGTTKEIFTTPRHPYTLALLHSIPTLSNEKKGRLYSIKGTPPDLLLPLEKCAFADRCDYCMPICQRLAPDATEMTDTHRVACWLRHEYAIKNGCRERIDAHA